MNGFLTGALTVLVGLLVLGLASSAYDKHVAGECEVAKLRFQAYDYCESGDGGAGCFLTAADILQAHYDYSFFYDHCGGPVPNFRNGD